MAGRLKHKAQAFVVLPTVFVVMACAAGAPAAAPRVSVIVSPRPGTVELGEAWRTTITVRKDGKRYSGASPRVELRARGATYRFPSSRIRRGVFQTKVALKRIGRWRVSILLAGRSVQTGTLNVMPGLTGALDVAVLPDGSLLVGDAANYVFRAPPGGRPTVVAGNGSVGSGGDGSRATAAEVGFPVEVASDPRGGFTIVSDERRIRRVAADGTISTLAELQQPTAHAHDNIGNVYVSELGGKVRRVDADTGTVTTLAEGLNQPHGLVVDADGAVIVCETFANRLVRIDPATGRVTAFAAGLTQPVDVVRAGDGALLVADSGNNRIARVARDRSVTTVVKVPRPQSVAVDAAGLVYFTEGALLGVRRVDPATAAVTTVLGRD